MVEGKITDKEFMLVWLSGSAGAVIYYLMTEITFGVSTTIYWLDAIIKALLIGIPVVFIMGFIVRKILKS